MARLILLNGPPAAGKSTLARQFLDHRPGALCLDLDLLWPWLGRWQDDLERTGTLARGLALAMARTHLAAGLDVIVPQFLGRPDFIDELAELAGNRFRHVVLLPPFEVIASRFDDRADHAVAEAGLVHLGGRPGLRQLYDRLERLARTRPDARILELTGTEEPDALAHRLTAVLAEYPTEGDHAG